MSNVIKEKLVSIILPVYNGEFYLGKAIQSCLDQTHSNLELIIVNDASTDKSLDIAKKYADADNRIRIISNIENKRLPASLNIGHKLAKGDFFTWTSHDNYYEDDAIQILLDHLIEREVDISYGNLNIIEENEDKRKTIQLGNSSKILFGNPIGAAFLYRKEVYHRNFGYNEDLHSVEDFDFWLRASLHSRFSHINAVIYNFRSHSESLTSKLSIADSKENMVFVKNLERAYLNFFKILNIEILHDLIGLFLSLHRYKFFDVSEFFDKYDEIELKLTKISSTAIAIDKNEVFRELDIRIRSNILNFKRNQTREVLFQILKKKPSILLKYDKKTSLRIIQKCI